MNILFVSSFPISETGGGVERVTTTLAKAFTERGGISVRYFILDFGEEGDILGVPQHFFPNGHGLKDIGNRQYFKNIILQHKISVVINQAGIYSSVIYFLRKNLPEGVRFFTVHHNCVACLQKNIRNILIEGNRSPLMKLLDNPVALTLLKYRNRIKYGKYFKDAICHSEKLVLLSDFFIPELGAYLRSWPSGRVVAIPNPSPFQSQPETLTKKENRIVYVGRIEFAQKQCNLLLDIWAAVSPIFPNWHLDIVGDGTKLDVLKSRATQLRLHNIHFHGRQKVDPFLEKAKILWMTSSFEGFPMVLMEAQAFGVVPVVFDSFSSLKSIVVHNESGLIIPAFDVKFFIDSVICLIKNENFREKMAMNSFLSLNKFHPDYITSFWLLLFQK